MLSRIPVLLRILIVGVPLLGLLLSAAAAVRVHRVTHPARAATTDLDFESMGLGVERVRFPAADGIELAGWFQPGRADRSAVILCHDLGRNKASLINLQIHLHQAGFAVLAFDFRGHGDSAGDGSTLGLEEKRDVLGAIEFLRAQPGLQEARLAAYGVGMGAHAVVLAASDRPALEVLVLDGLYPDVGYALEREFFRGWPGGTGWLRFVPRAMFRLTTGDPQTGRAAEHLPRLLRREVLLVVPAGDSALASELQTMYESLPERPGFESSLVTLPATEATGLYGEEVDRFHGRITDFLALRLH